VIHLNREFLELMNCILSLLADVALVILPINKFNVHINIILTYHIYNAYSLNFPKFTVIVKATFFFFFDMSTQEGKWRLELMNYV
jgi:hypothetical protein